MTESLTRWGIGLFVSVIIGGIVTGLFLTIIRKCIGLGEKPGSGPRVPPWVTGAVERLFFTVLGAFNISGTGTAMVAWIALKFATNWNRPDWKKNIKTIRPFAFSALLAGLVSMLFAVLGALICSGQVNVGLGNI